MKPRSAPVGAGSIPDQEPADARAGSTASEKHADAQAGHDATAMRQALASSSHASGAAAAAAATSSAKAAAGDCAHSMWGLSSSNTHHIVKVSQAVDMVDSKGNQVHRQPGRWDVHMVQSKKKKGSDETWLELQWDNPDGGWLRFWLPENHCAELECRQIASPHAPPPCAFSGGSAAGSGGVAQVGISY